MNTFQYNARLDEIQEGMEFNGVKTITEEKISCKCNFCERKSAEMNFRKNVALSLRQKVTRCFKIFC